MRKPLTDKDGEVRELTAEDFAAARPLADIDPDLPAAMQRLKNKGGRPKVDAPKVHLGLRLAADLVDGIKATGQGYGTRVERVLREALAAGRLDSVKH